VKFNASVIPVGKGEYGPFDVTDKETGNVSKVSYPYYDLAAEDGSGSHKATLAQGVTMDAPLFKPVLVTLELTDKGKLRCHGLAKAA
jgi:hypothetical protein